VSKLSGAFKDIAKEFDVPFVALAQVNRGVESQSILKYTKHDRCMVIKLPLLWFRHKLLLLHFPHQ